MQNQFIDLIKAKKIPYMKVGDNIMIPCVFHLDKNPSLGVNFKKMKYNCLGCGKSGKGIEAIKYLLKKILDEDSFDFEENIEKSDPIDLSLLKDRLKDLGKKEDIPKIKILKNFNLEEYETPRDEYLKYLEKRKINKHSIEKFNIRCGYWKGEKRIIIPMYDEYNRLVSILGRSIENNTDYRISKAKGSDVNKILFGLNYLLSNNSILKFGVMEEGEIDALYLQQNNIPAFSVGKKYPSEIQIRKMARYFQKVILNYDGDVPKSYRLKMKRRIGEYVEVDEIEMPKNRDANDLSINGVKRVYSSIL
jgi:DNA primase